MDSLVRPRSSSSSPPPQSPPIPHARSLSPRSVVFGYDFPEDGESDGMDHLQQPCEVHLDYDNYFRDWNAAGDSDKNNNDKNNNYKNNNDKNNNYKNNTTTTTITPLRPIARSTGASRNNNKRKLLSPESPPRNFVNLRHRKVSSQTMEWLASSSISSSNHNHGPPSILDAGTGYEPVSPRLAPSRQGEDEDERHGDQQQRQQQQQQHQPPPGGPVEELWLGPVFDSSQTVLEAITSLPVSVSHLDLDLRNALHLLPQAMPLLFGRHHLTTLSLRVFGDAGAVELAKWMNSNPNLEHLDLRGNRIGSTGARAIVDAVLEGRGNHNKNNDDDNDTNKNLSLLNLSCNCILHGDMIGELLEENSTLETLDLAYNWIGNQEVRDICTGLRKNTTLRELNLVGCHRISQTGMKTLLACLRDTNTSLHKIGLQAFDEEGKRLVEEINYWLRLNRAGRYLIKSRPPPPTLSPPLPKQSPQPGADRGATRDRPATSPGHRHPDPAPLGLWPRVLEKSNADPGSVFHLLRAGPGAAIGNRHR